MSEPRKVVLVGAGALGSHLVQLGRGWPVRWTIVDFDRVEQKNLLSQFHTKMGLGRNKAQALKQALQGLWGLDVTAVPHRLAEENAATLLAGADLVLDCVDNAPTRELISRTVRASGVACLHGAVAADGAYARIMWDPVFRADEGAEGAATCEDGEHLPFVGLVAAKMAGLAQEWLTTGRARSVHLHPGGMLTVA